MMVSYGFFSCCLQRLLLVLLTCQNHVLQIKALSMAHDNFYDRVRDCDWLVANATKKLMLATSILKLVASRRLTFCPLGIWNSKLKKLRWTIVVERNPKPSRERWQTCSLGCRTQLLLLRGFCKSLFKLLYVYCVKWKHFVERLNFVLYYNVR